MRTIVPVILGLLMSLQTYALTISYEYLGQTLEYEVIDAARTTCKVIGRQNSAMFLEK